MLKQTTLKNVALFKQFEIIWNASRQLIRRSLHCRSTIYQRKRRKCNYKIICPHLIERLLTNALWWNCTVRYIYWFIRMMIDSFQHIITEIFVWSEFVFSFRLSYLAHIKVSFWGYFRGKQCAELSIYR